MTYFHLCLFLTIAALLSMSSGAPQNPGLFSRQDLVDPSTSDVASSPVLPDPSMDQVIPQQNIQIGSQTDVNPVTGIYPNVIYQPSLQLYNPLVTGPQPYSPYDYNDSGFEYGDYSGDILPMTPGVDSTFSKRQSLSIPSDGPLSLPDPSNDISTNIVIKPIIRIQPHALQPVPVPVSDPYTVPVPVPVGVGGGRYDYCDDCDDYDDYDDCY